MMSAGVPLVQAFEIIGRGHENAGMRELILKIKAEVESGTSLAETLAKHPTHFDELVVSLVGAGEQAGVLETLLDKIATYKEKTESLKAKIKKALFYPTAVMVVAFIVTAILLIFVVPQFEDLFSSFGADLPAFTRDGGQSVRVHAGILVDRLRHRRRRCRGHDAGQEALQQIQPRAGPDHPEDADHRRHHAQGGHRPLCAHPVDHVRRRRAPGRGA